MTAFLACCALALLIAGEGWWLLWFTRDRWPGDTTTSLTFAGFSMPIPAGTVVEVTDAGGTTRFVTLEGVPAGATTVTVKPLSGAEGTEQQG